MYLSSRDIKWAIHCNQLIVDPRPESFPDGGFDETSIDLHLDKVEEAKVWDIAKFQQRVAAQGTGPEIRLGKFKYTDFSEDYLIAPPEETQDDKAKPQQSVFRRGCQVIVKPWGFVLWQTKEKIGTPNVNPNLISFVNAKSTRTTGVVVHMTAPTIHAGWQGKVVLEISNMGPFHFILQEDDVIAQLTVAQISSPPDLGLKTKLSQTAGQAHVTGAQ